MGGTAPLRGQNQAFLSHLKLNFPSARAAFCLATPRAPAAATNPSSKCLAALLERLRDITIFIYLYNPICYYYYVLDLILLLIR